MEIIIAPDSFKGSLTAVEAAEAMDRGIKNVYPEANTYRLPVGDGGEGTMETLVAATKGKIKKMMVTGPLGEKIEAAYGVLGDGETCVIEMAMAAGLALVSEKELDPLKTTTYGVGELIIAALNEGYRSFLIALGGSATNDGGAGMLQALGMKLLDERDMEIDFGGVHLGHISSIDVSGFDKRIHQSKIIIASDVENPFIGENGASHIFGPQKGATPEMLEHLERNMIHWADKIAETTDVSLHHLKGAGAAGGLGGALLAFFPAQMEKGIEVVLRYVGFEQYLKTAQLVLTGEGKVDHQTAFGKTPQGVAKAAWQKQVPTIILAGTVDQGIESLYDYGVVSVQSILNEPMSTAEAMKNADTLLEKSTEQAVRLFFHQ